MHWLIVTANFLNNHNAVITALATVLLAFVTGGLVFIGYEQYKTTRAQLRAYISVYSGLLYEQSERDGTVFELRPIMKNTGQTPAYNVTFKAKIGALPWPLPPNFDLSFPQPQNPSVSVLGPSQESFMNVFGERRFTIEEMIEMFSPSNLRLHVFGTVTYDDVFEISRTTDFCYFIIWGSKGLLMWMLSPQHNRAD